MSLTPPQPAYVLRGHGAQIHSTTFIRRNSRLVTGDADGWIVLWSLATRRATAVWRAHEGAILGSAEWGPDRMITHGKDNKLVVWKLREEDEADMSKALPVDDAASTRKMPWILHILHVNTLNFCSFAYCHVETKVVELSDNVAKVDMNDELLIAVPNAVTSEAVDVFHLPSEKRLYTVQGDKSLNTGMVMAVAILHQNALVTIICGFESGHTTVSTHLSGAAGSQTLYLAQPHSQPILSLAVIPDRSFYLTSSADAVIAKHPIPSPKTSTLTPPSQPQTQPLKTSHTKHAGQQSLRLRSDAKIFATAGWDARLRVYSTVSLKELAVLKWHNEGCYAVAFAEVGLGDVGREGTARDEEEGGNAVGIENIVADGGEGGAVTEDLVPRGKRTGLGIGVREMRTRKTRETHWLAGGSKDGKVSLWDIY